MWIRMITSHPIALQAFMPPSSVFRRPRCSISTSGKLRRTPLPTGSGEVDVRIIPGAKPLVEACGMVNKICRRTFLLKNTLWADEAIAYGEDILWSNLAALACESYITSDTVLYNYRQRKNSVSGLKNVEKNAERRLADSVAITERYFKLYNTQKNPAKRKKTVSPVSHTYRTGHASFCRL